VTNSDQAAEFRELIAQLHEPRTRRRARQKLVAARAVEPLLECLESTNESVVWAAVQSLGELRAAEAVEPLVALMERGVLVLDVSEALAKITGNRFGTHATRWREWLGSPNKTRAPQMDVQECVRRTGGYLGVEPTGSGNSFRFKFSLLGERAQTVAVYFGREDAEGEELLVIYSECGPADARYYEAVLRKNMSIPAGAFAIRDVGGKPNFVMVDTMLADTVTPDALARKIENIAARADIVEKSLTREDKR